MDLSWLCRGSRRDGLFRRFCRTNGEWRDCAPADADDSMLALWMQLLYRMAPAAGMPADGSEVWPCGEAAGETAQSAAGCVSHLARNHVALLMDNIEVYAALKDVAQGQHRLDDPAAATTDARAEQLARPSSESSGTVTQRFRSSMQKNPPAFYPDVVAQVYPWLAELNGPGRIRGRPGSSGSKLRGGLD